MEAGTNVVDGGRRYRGSVFVAAVTVLVAVPALSAELRKGPYLLYEGDPTSMVVLWQTDGPAGTCTLEHGPDTSFASGPIEVGLYGDDQYRYTIEGLQPGALQHYRVTVDGQAQEGVFRAAPPLDVPSVTLYAYGDSRSDPETHDRLLGRLLADRDERPEQRHTVCLHTGDLVYAGASEADWQGQAFSRAHEDLLRAQRELPVIVVRGNHDVGGQVLGKYLPPPAAAEGAYYYSFDYGPVHIAVVDDNGNLGPSSEQVRWLEADLRDSDRPWKVVMLHAPAWSAGGQHGNDPDAQRLTEDLFEPLGVDLVLGGHNHYYARNVKDGVTHVTSGGGGAPLHRPQAHTPHQVTSIRAHHFLRFDVGVEVIAVTVVDIDGAVIDQFEIEGGNDGATQVALDGDRPVPDYDGRGDAPPTAGEVLVWIPRGLLGPLYGVNEIVFHRPLGLLVTELERQRLPGKLQYLMENWPRGLPGVFPTTLIEFGFRPSIGLYVFWNGIPTESGRFRVHAAHGGKGWWQLKVKQRFDVRMRQEGGVAPYDRTQILLRFDYSKRPDHKFFGVGPEPAKELTRFSREQIGGSIGLELRLGNLDRIEFKVEVERNHLGHGWRNVNNPEPSIEDHYDVSDPEQVPGWPAYTLGAVGVELQLDTRTGVPPEGSGFRIEALAELGADLADPGQMFLRYGGSVAGIFGPPSTRRSIHLRQDIVLIQPLEGSVVPFTEQIEIGGTEWMRGFPLGRYRGMSAWVSTVEYVYPIWVFLDGVVFAEVGNVFGTNFEGFSFAKMAASSGIGIRTVTVSDGTIDLLLGFGSSRFDDPPFRVDEVRFVIGVNKGF